MRRSLIAAVLTARALAAPLLCNVSTLGFFDTAGNLLPPMAGGVQGAVIQR